MMKRPGISILIDFLVPVDGLAIDACSPAALLPARPFLLAPLA